MKPVGLGKQVCCELDGDNGSQPDCHLTRVTTRGLVDVALDCSQVEKDLPATLDEKLSGLGQLTCAIAVAGTSKLSPWLRNNV